MPLRISAGNAQRNRTSFIGRAQERFLLAQELVKGAGLLTLSGPSGIGKTRLAYQVVEEVAASFEGAWFCNLIGSQEVVHVEAAVARALGISDESDQDLIRALGRRGKILLVLDNLDVVAPKIGDLLGSWIDRCPELQLFVTSILPVGIEGEIRFDLGPLEPADAVALYLERAKRASARKVFTAKEEEEVEELVTRLDRLPLAIELAAARVQVLPPRMLLSRIEERFRFLRSQVEGRHGSLLGALTMTWDLLTELEQRTLAKASIFENGFTLEAAMSVLGAAEEEVELDLLDLLADLRSKALLQIDESETPRYLLFESVRDFAAEKLREAGRYEETLERFSTWLVEEGEKRAGGLEGPDELEAGVWLHAERDNLLAVLDRNLERHPAAAARAGLVLLTLLLAERPHSPSKTPLVEKTLRAARASGDPRLLASALGEHASSSSLVRPEEASSELEEALALAREAKDRELEGKLLVREARNTWSTDDFGQTATLLARAVAIGREEGFPEVEVRALLGKAALAFDHRNYQEVDETYERMIALVQANGLHRLERVVLVWIAAAWMGQGRFREAKVALLEALPKLREAVDRQGEANALLNLGVVNLVVGNLDEAERHLLDALVICRELGSRRGEALVSGNLGNIALERGQLELAESRLLECLTAQREVGARKRNQMAVLPFLAVVEARLGRLVDARRTLEEARSYFREVEDRSNLGTIELLEGTLELAEARHLGSGREAAALALRAEERLARVRAKGGTLNNAMFEAARILETDLAAWVAQEGQSEPIEQEVGLRLGPAAAWFELPGQERVELMARTSLRHLLDALATTRLDAPGKALGAHQLFEAGWPGVEIHPDSAASRVYVSIWRLRDAGLADVLLSQSDGYLLDPTIPLVRLER